MIQNRRLRLRHASGLFAACLCLASAGPARSDAGSINLLCSVQIEWCQAMALGFRRETGVQVRMTQMGAGEALALLRADARNPKTDVWFGGSHLVAARDDLTEAFTPEALQQLQPWARLQHAAAGARTVGAYAGGLGFAFNADLLRSKGLPAPACWADLLKPAYRGEIQMANPNASATAYAFLLTLVALKGEDEAFAYLKALHPNINAYTRSGTAPVKAVARGETAISLSFIHDAVTEKLAGFPVGHAAPCEGTGYEIGSVSVIHGARNREAAQAFVTWALTPSAQALGFTAARQLQTPSNTQTPLPPGMPDLAEFKLVTYDFARSASPEERRRLLARWDAEIGALPR